MSAERRLRVILDAATPGPWQEIGQVLNAGAHRLGDTQDVCCFGHSGQECTDDEMETWALADARAIVVARNLLPVALPCIESLREAVGAWVAENGPPDYPSHPPAWYRDADAALDHWDREVATVTGEEP